MAGPAGRTARGTAKQDPAFQLAAVPAFHDIAGAGRKGREDGKRGEEESGWDGRRWKIIG